jgi:hypothetical protein
MSRRTMVEIVDCYEDPALAAGRAWLEARREADRLSAIARHTPSYADRARRAREDVALLEALIHQKYGTP